MGRLGFAVVALCACGRISFDERSDGALDSPDDGEPPRVVQHESNFVGGGRSVTVALPSPVTAQNLVLVLSSTSRPNSFTAPTDSQGNPYDVITQGASVDINDARMATYATTVASSGALSVTCHDDNDFDNLHCHVYELHRVTSTLDTYGFVEDLASSSFSVSTFQPSLANSFLVGYFVANNTQGVFTAGPGYGEPETTDSPSNDIAFSETAFATSSGVQTATATTTLADNFICMIVALEVR